MLGVVIYALFSLVLGVGTFITMTNGAILFGQRGVTVSSYFEAVKVSAVVTVGWPVILFIVVWEWV